MDENDNLKLTWEFPHFYTLETGLLNSCRKGYTVFVEMQEHSNRRKVVIQDLTSWSRPCASFLVQLEPHHEAEMQPQNAAHERLEK